MDSIGKQPWQLKRKLLIDGGGKHVCVPTLLRQSNRLNFNTPAGREASSALPLEFSQKRNHILPGESSTFSHHAKKISDKGSSQEVPQTFMADSMLCGSSKKILANVGNTSVPRILSRKLDKELIRSIWTRAKARMSIINQENEVGVVNPYRSVLRHSNRKDYTLRNQGPNRRHPHNFITQDRNDLCEDKTSNPNQEQECCRTLQFEDFKALSDDEVTQPLDMMDMTAMISGASVFQDPKKCQRMAKPQSQRKVNFLDRTSKCENPVVEQEKCHDRFEDVEKYSQCAVGRTSNDSGTIPKKAVTSRIPPPKIKVTETKTAENGCKQTNKSRILKRRSAIPTFKATPKYLIKRDLRSKSTSKLSTPQERHQKDPTSKVETRCSSRNISRRSAVVDITKIVIEGAENDAKLSKCDVAVNTEAVEKCNSATNTSMQYIYGETLKSNLVREVQKLNEEIDEIKRKADFISEQTIARRKRMKESHVMENFLTSISPLKRIHALLHENDSSHEDVNCSRVSSVPEANMASGGNTESLCLDACDMDLTIPNDTAVSDNLMDRSVLNTTSDIHVTQSKWKHLKLNSRVFHTTCSQPQKRDILLPSPPEIEHFNGTLEDNVSPFTEMAGDCERPSLAPMTPHSHKQVSMLKLSLRKQLDQLYE